MCDRFILADKLYGRQLEVDQLLAAFERTCQGDAELILVAGPPALAKPLSSAKFTSPLATSTAILFKENTTSYRAKVLYLALFKPFVASFDKSSVNAMPT